MAEKLPGQAVDVNDWNLKVLKLGYQDTDTPALFEVRVIDSNGQPLLKRYNGTGWEIIGGEALALLGTSGSALAYNSNPVWDTGNMGPGSGMDADTTDGVHLWKLEQVETVNSGSGTHTIDFPTTFVNPIPVVATNQPHYCKISTLSSSGVGFLKGAVTYNVYLVVCHE